MRILFFATYPTQATGYARIGNILTNHLAARHEVHYLGISNFTNQAIGRDIHPGIRLIDALTARAAGSTELYGVDVICGIIKRIKPDLVFIYNDVIVINRILNEFIAEWGRTVKPFRLSIYMDMVYDFQRPELFRNIGVWADQILVFSDCWKRNLETIGLPPAKVFVLPHGFDTRFGPVSSVEDAKEKMGFKPDDFVVLNTNRNAYRKAIDITIEAFVLFLVKRQYSADIKLFLNMVMASPQGYDIHNLIKVVCLKNGVDYGRVVTNHIFIRPADFLTESLLNTLYLASDVGINTCLGEGFGLCNLEHACIGRPQVVSGVGALADIFSDKYATVVAPRASLYLSEMVEGHQGYVHVCEPRDFADALEKYYADRELAAWHGARGREALTKKYDWAAILAYLDSILASGSAP